MSVISTQLRSKAMFATAAQVKDEGVTIRPSSTALFGVDSDDRYSDYNQRRVNPSYPFSISITKNESLLNGFFKRIAVAELRLNWTLPNISVAWGNHQIIIAWNLPAPGSATITMPTAFYTIQNFCDVFAAQVQAIPGNPLPNFTATRAEDGTILFASNTATQFALGPVTTSLTTIKQRQLFDMLSLSTPALATTLLSGIPNLRATDFIDVVSPQLTYNQDLKDSTSAPIVRDALVRVYLDESCKPIAPPKYTSTTAPPYDLVPSFTNGNDVNGMLPFVIYRQYSMPKQIKWDDTQPLGNVTFELYDDQGRSLQDLWTAAFAPNSAVGIRFANSFVWNMSLLMSEN